MRDGSKLRRAVAVAALAAHGERAVKRRATRRVTLVLIGAASVSACDDPGPSMVNRDLYEHRTKCVQDWGDEKKCELITDGQHRGYWYGPGYTGTRSSTPGYRGPPDAGSGTAGLGNTAGTHRVARSGFGSSASAHSSGS